MPHAANTDDEGRLDIRVFGVPGMQYAFFDVRVFHPNTLSYCTKSLNRLYRQHESAKKREYGQ
jgi:hypothetical protein